MELSEREREIVDLFKSAGFSGRVFRSMEALERHLESTSKPGISCPGYGRRISEEVCSWHKEEKDPVCVDCLRMEE
jgi:hypothetical protein